MNIMQQSRPAAKCSGGYFPIIGGKTDAAFVFYNIPYLLKKVYQKVGE